MKSKPKISYGIYRYGANANNQPGREKELVTIVEAKTRAEAEECEQHERPGIYDSAWLKLDPEVTIWANQRVEAVPVSKIPAAVLRAFYEANY